MRSQQVIKMDNINTVDALLIGQYGRYPSLEAQDLVKALYQSEFGCGHFVSDDREGLERLVQEEKESVNATRDNKPDFIEKFSGDYCRVHLSRIREYGLSVETLFRLFVLSGRIPCGDAKVFTEKLDRLETLCESGLIPLDADDTRRYLQAYRQDGCPATHHSDVFRRAYAPCYRVVQASLCEWMPVLCGIDKLMARQSSVLVAIDGGSASGKTALSALLHSVYDCNVFHMDDFFLQPHQRTEQRFKEPGGNVDYERFKEEVLDLLLRGEALSYRAFDCGTMKLGMPTPVTPKRLNIVEGAYSMHPALAYAYDFSVLLDIDADCQRERIFRRNGPDTLSRFLETWIPLESLYFDKTGTAARCTVTLMISDKAAGEERINEEI